MSRLADGAEAETSVIGLFDHFGTHMDAPAHFLEGGKTLGDFDIGNFDFERTLLLDIPKGYGEAVTRADLERRAGYLPGPPGHWGRLDLDGLALSLRGRGGGAP